MSHQLIGTFISLAVTAFVIRLLLQKYQAQMVLLGAGMLLLVVAVFLGAGSGAILPPKVKSSGFIGFDIYEFIKSTMSSRVAHLGLIIMSAGGFAKYMDKIGASRIMGYTAVKPLQVLKSPYLILALAYIIGTSMRTFIGSATGLAMILMVTVFPLVVALGVSPIASAAMIVTTGCFDLGPASANANLAAQNVGLSVTEYFVRYQIPVAAVGYVTVAALHFFTARHFDRKEKVGAIYGGEAGVVGQQAAAKQAEDEGPMPPKFYMVLPTLPLVLLLVFSEYGVPWIKMDVTTAMFISFSICLVIECLRLGDLKKGLKEGMIFFDAMGKMFSSVVTLVVAGETFAQGLTAIGAINTLIEGAKGVGFGPTGMTLVMVVFITVATVVMGSGNAPFFAFAALAPRIAKEVGFPAIYIMLPMGFSVGLSRALSPIAAVTVAVASMAGLSPFDVVKRTAIPVVGALITTNVAAMILAG